LKYSADLRFYQNVIVKFS